MRDNPVMDYFNRLLQAYEGELYGQTLYEDLAASMSNPEQARKWQMLARMETVMGQLLRDLLDHHRIQPRPDDLWQEQAARDLAEYAPLPWAELMRRFHDELAVDIAAYQALEEDCLPRDAEILGLLTRHEFATRRFCELELAGQSAQSLQPVEQLIQEIKLLQRRPDRSFHS